MGQLSPAREIAVTLDNGDKIKTVAFVGTDKIGLECFTASKVLTRAIFSKEAVIAIVSSLSGLAAGGGKEIKREWRHVPDHELTRHLGDKDNNQEICVPLWMAQEFLTFMEAKAASSEKETIIPIGSINALKEIIDKITSE